MLMKRICIIGLILLGRTIAVMAGTWIPVTNTAPFAVDTMLLLPDGTVMATVGAANGNNPGGNSWARLTPDAQGRYANGRWTSLAPMHDTRLYFSSDVLANGQVMVAGGEYGTGGGSAEIYDPQGGTWTMAAVSLSANGEFLDSISETLPNGNVLVAPVFNNNGAGRAPVIYNFAANDFTQGPAFAFGISQDEASWLKLPDTSILTVDLNSTLSERYIPALNHWVPDASVPVFLYDAQSELGPAFLLPNGNAIFFGASGHTAIYTPSGTTNSGTWTAGPDMPNGLGMPDAPGAMMANGKILCTLGTPGTFNGPNTFCEYDYVANSFTVVAAPPTGGFSPYASRMLVLPDGTALFSWSNSHLYIYQPDGPQLAAGKPSIYGVTTNCDGSFRLAGTQLNGISEGAAYGDDAQMASDYPLIYVTNGASVYYLKTFNWSSTDVMTGTNVVTTDFTVPTNIPAGSYSLYVSANGISSDPMAFTVGPVTPNPATIYLTNGDIAPNASFNSGLNWASSAAPAGMNNYVVSGCDLCTPSAYVEMVAFRGGSLYLTNGGALRIMDPLSGDTTTIGALPGRTLVMNGGVVSDWAAHPETLGGYINLTNNGNIFDPQTNILTLGGIVSGSGSATPAGQLSMRRTHCN